MKQPQTARDQNPSAHPLAIASGSNLEQRHRTGLVWQGIFSASTLVGIVALITLLFTILNDSFGYTAYEYKLDPTSLSASGLPLDHLTKDELIAILRQNISTNAYNNLENQKPFSQRSQSDVYDLVYERVIKPDVAKTWTLFDSLFHRSQIFADAAADYPEATLSFTYWINVDFLTDPQSSDPLFAGIRTAILGSLWTIAITILVALPLGIGAAIYLEEYARDNWVNRVIQTNINNLAGVPSIIYGILGLAIFVRLLEPLTSGAIFGIGDPLVAKGRTILSAGLTLALLILPLIIINGQEAIRSVPNSLRQASYGIGATKWQTIWHHVLPNAIPGILTGAILAVSRAIGETAPLVVIGASTYISFDPNGPFSKFTALPIQIYQWVSRPQSEFRNIAAAAIIALMVLLLSLNAAAIYLRNRFQRRYS